jgi:hypothetical protein
MSFYPGGLLTALFLAKLLKGVPAAALFILFFHHTLVIDANHVKICRFCLLRQNANT